MRTLVQAGDAVVPLVREKSSAGVYWDPKKGHVDPAAFEGFDAVVHLAGENIAARRWTKKQREKLFQSRVRDTWLLAKTVSRLSHKPKIFLSASACGFYGDRGNEHLTEASPKGQGFLADLCEKWESATHVLEQDGIRVLHPRFGVVLSPQGGMLAKMVPLFRWGLGGKLGSGQQYLCWISLEDAVKALVHLLKHSTIQGAVNLTAPHPVTQEEFARTLARHLHRPCFFHIPAPLVQLAFGKMAQELLLASQNVYPEKLLNEGFSFRHATQDQALSAAFGSCCSSG